MRALKTSAFAAACFLLCACSEGLYSATAAGDGYVVVVNRMTGDAHLIRGDIVIDLKPPAGAAPKETRSLTGRSIPSQPIVVRGAAKYRDGSMLVKVWVSPTLQKMTNDELVAWRIHLRELKDSASLQLQFLDEDSFEIVSHSVPLNTMTQVVDEKGDVTDLETQVTVAMTHESYALLRDWSVGWNGFWPAYVPALTERPDVPQKPKG